MEPLKAIAPADMTDYELAHEWYKAENNLEEMRNQLDELTRKVKTLANSQDTIKNYVAERLKKAGAVVLEDAVVVGMWKSSTGYGISVYPKHKEE